MLLEQFGDETFRKKICDLGLPIHGKREWFWDVDLSKIECDDINTAILKDIPPQYAEDAEHFCQIIRQLKTAIKDSEYAKSNHKEIDYWLLQYQIAAIPLIGAIFRTVEIKGDICSFHEYTTSNNKIITYIELTNESNAKKRITVKVNGIVPFHTDPTELCVKVTGKIILKNDGKFFIDTEPEQIIAIGDQHTAYQRQLSQWKTLYPKSHKKKIAHLIKKIGIISTGKDGAGYHDFIAKLNQSIKKNCSIENTVLGRLSREALPNAIKKLDTQGLDCICIVRGGGSKFDLLPFCSPEVISAIYDAKTPIAIGIGHENDKKPFDKYASISGITPTDLAVQINNHSIEHYREQLKRESAEIHYMGVPQDTELLLSLRKKLSQYEKEIEALQHENNKLRQKLEKYELGTI